MRRWRAALCTAGLGACLIALSCGSPTAPGNPPPIDTVATVLAAGDIGECGYGPGLTADLLDNLSGTILALGDIAYPNGTAANFRDCYDPFWGRHKSRTKPVPGNHEYENPQNSPAAYFDYFGELAGPRNLGYYAFTAGSWRVIALNSEIPFGAGSAQLAFLRNELQTNKTQCTLAYWHRPLFSSGPNGPQGDTRILWTTLIEFGADVVLNGHDHLYERFAVQDADGRASATGIRQITAGTGGAHLYTFGVPSRNSESRASVYGILIMTLTNNGYAWDFISVNGSFRDTGGDSCH
jgi:hypothetical protein